MFALQVIVPALAAIIVGGLVLSRSLPLAETEDYPESGDKRLPLPIITAWLTALMAAGLAGIAAWLVISYFILHISN